MIPRLKFYVSLLRSLESSFKEWGSSAILDENQGAVLILVKTRFAINLGPKTHGWRIYDVSENDTET
jgi:hypothetical protein